MAEGEPTAVEALAAEIMSSVAELPARDTASIRGVRRGYSRQLRSAEAETILALAFRLVQEHLPDLRFVAYELVRDHPAAAGRLDAPLLERLGGELGSWEAVDTFACNLSGRAWQRRQVPDALIHGWAHSPDRWWRRSALVSTVSLNTRAHGGTGDAERTLAVCSLLIDDRDDMVVKALSWALRALAVRDPVAVQDFLTRHEERLAPRVLREVRNKLSTGLKTPRKIHRDGNAAEDSISPADDLDQTG